jgi:hypothetical protein
MRIAASNQTVPAPVRTARAAAATPTVKGVLDTYKKTQEAPPSKMSQYALWSAGASLAAGVVLGVLGKPAAAVVCVLSAVADGIVALVTRH